MSHDTRQDDYHSNLADALDRLADAMEQQGRSLEGLRAQVGALGDAIRHVEQRLERNSPAQADAVPAKARGKKRPK